MPHENFYKLDENKRNKIIEAMKKEFSRVPFHEASVTRIVEDAGISKGSFWVYFESKEEAIHYLIESHLQEERKKSMEIFQKNNGDLFESYMEIYDYFSNCEITEEDKKLMANIFRSLITNEEKCITKEPGESLIEETKNIINTSNLRLNEDEDLIRLMKILNYIMRSNLVDTFCKKVSQKEARNHFFSQLTMLKNGVLK